MATHAWTEDRIVAMESDKIKNLMNNALRAGQKDLVDLCEEVLLARRKNDKATDRVSQFHFVVDTTSDATDNGNGTFWTPYVDIAKGHFANSVTFNSQVGLHLSDRGPSFLAGKITRWEENADGQVRFLAKTGKEALPWIGEGDGTTGLKWVVVR